ncbi:MAG: phytanoyl-CoA dioxygenase family protein [Halofilum sp. (in: g-proteobacteria)]|nr:phytanoyl-CoA dioxygenase family protein [Halofilum sp. (in: g-proteobacteria)]
MSAIQFLAQVPPADWLRRRVYAGDLLIVRGIPEMHELVDYCHDLLVETFETNDLLHAQFTLGRADWDRRAADLRKRGKKDPGARERMTALFAAFGLDPARTAADVVNLRCQPHDDDPGPDSRHTLGAHRDTWGSNVYQQINWWAPVCPITAERTIAFFPGCWDRSVANDSRDWDLDAIRAEIAAARAEAREPVFPNVPEPTEPGALGGALPVVIEPGDVLLFSGAHLHASVPNGSGAARYSLELRSVDERDAAAGIGAPNLDGHAPRVAWHWFRRLADDARMQAPGAEPGPGGPAKVRAEGTSTAGCGE